MPTPKLIPIVGQSLLDLALQSAGSVEAAFSLADQNGMRITDRPAPGSTLAADLAITDTTVAEFMQRQGIRPATAEQPTDATGGGIGGRLQGVDYWIVEQDFIVT